MTGNAAQKRQTPPTHTKRNILVTAVFFLVAALLYRHVTQFAERQRVISVLEAMQREEEAGEAEGEAVRHRKPRILVGFGGCVDVKTFARPVFDLVGLYPNISQRELETQHQREKSDDLQSLAQIEAEFSNFFMEGAAAERYLNNRTLFAELVRAAQSLPSNITKVALGGNAPVMANRMGRNGAEVLLVAKISDDMKRLAHPSVKFFPLDDEEPTEKEKKGGGKGRGNENDYHLVLEYAKDEEWGEVRTPRSNRYILHHDWNMPNLAGIERFSSKLPDLLSVYRSASVELAKARTNAARKTEEEKTEKELEGGGGGAGNGAGNGGGGRVFEPAPPFDNFVVGGLQMMDGFQFEPPTLLDEKIHEVTRVLQMIPRDTSVHFEMASFVNPAMAAHLATHILPYADSIGMNEQELPNLLSILESGAITTVSSAFPRVNAMLDMLRRVYDILQRDGPPPTSSSASPPRRVSRLHLHTLGFQIILVDSRSRFWLDSRLSIVKAALTANRHACGAHQIDVQRSRLLMDDSFRIYAQPGAPRMHFNATNPVHCWRERERHICVAPNIVCTQTVQTVGGGDNISAAALLTQLRLLDQSPQRDS